MAVDFMPNCEEVILWIVYLRGILRGMEGSNAAAILMLNVVPTQEFPSSAGAHAYTVS